MLELFENIKLFPAFIGIFPTFFYSMVLYFLLPKNTISFRRMRKYFAVGLASPLILLFTYYVFPDISSFKIHNVPFSDLFITLFIAAFLEEASKFGTFEWLNKNRVSAKKDTPLAIMMYSLSVAAGFSITENFHYAMNFGNDFQLLALRGISANVMHLLCGIMIGYFVAKASIIKNPILKTKNQIFNNSQIFISKFFIVCFGILTSTVYHTLYNSNMIISSKMHISYLETTFALFLIGILIVYYMFKEMIIRTKNLEKENEKK